MDPRIAVAVGDVDFTVGRDGGARRMVERGHPSRNVPLADPQQHFALEVEDDNLMRVAIGDPDAVPAVDRNAVRIEDLALPVAANERAVRVEDEHRRLAAPQHMHISQRVDGDLADARRRDVGRPAAEIAFDRIASASYGHMAQLRRR